MNYLRTLQRTILGAVFLMLCSQAQVNAQCGNTSLNINTSVSQGDRCGSNTEEFSISNPPQYDQIKWSWGDGNTRTSQNTSENFNYTDPGTYTPTVEFLDANGDVICEVSAGSDITIFHNPSADFNYDSRQVQCIQNNEFDFEDQSTEGADGAPITDWTWTFGDGNSSNDQNPTHSYAQGGEYPIVLQIKDANGCTDVEQKVDQFGVEVTQQINPSFNVRYLTNNGRPTCPKTEVQFDNQTPNQGRVQSYTFEPGDGSGSQSLSVPWSSVKHTYEDDGKFAPTLTVKDTNGCEEKYVGSAENIDFDFDQEVLIGDSVECKGNAAFTFSHTVRNRAENMIWNFGHDPQPNPEVINEWVWTQDYGSNYGIFDVTLTIKESEDCVKDTVYPGAVAIEGPIANIQHPDIPMGSPPNTFVGPADQPLPPEYFKEINGNECKGISQVDYVENPDPTETTKTWQRGDPVPSDTFYRPPSGTYNFQNVHDTDIYHRSCEAPNLVRFTNNSVKYRLDRDSTGDILDPFQATEYADDGTKPLTDPNSPVPQWGSDSLEYFWRFQDPTGKSCTTRYDWQGRQLNSYYERRTKKIPYGPNDTFFLVDSPAGTIDSMDASFLRVYDENGDSLMFEYGVDYTGLVDPGPVDSLYGDFLYFNWDPDTIPSAGTPVDSFLLEYYTIDTTKVQAKCNFSTATVPYHRFDTSICFSVQLEVYDSVTGCSDNATIQIFTTAPDAGWDESYYEQDRNLTYQNYNGENSIAFDSLMHWTDSVGNVSPRQLLADRILLDKDFTVINDNGLPVSSSTYEVVNRDLAWLKFGNSKPPNGQLQISYSVKRPQIFPSGDTVTIDTMTYSMQNRLNSAFGPNNGPRRGVRLQGPKCEGATQQIQNLAGTYPASQCGSYGKEFGFIPERGTMTDTIQCSDSLDTNNDGSFDDTVIRDKVVGSWVPGSQVVANPLAWNWEFEYSEPGCKSLGLWIQTGDCYDTFWYDNYKYIADNDPNHELLKEGTDEAYTDEEIQEGFCIGEIGVDSFAFRGVPRYTDQQDIVEYEFSISSMDEYISDEDYSFLLGEGNYVDTIVRFCTDSIVTTTSGGQTVKACSENLINYPERTCGKSVTDELSIQDMINSADYNLFDSLYVIDLRDTADLAIKEPGVYSRVSQITNAQGCTDQTEIQEPLYVGHYSNYEAFVPNQDNDSTICIGDTVYFKNPNVGLGNHFYYIDNHLPAYFERHEVELGNRTEIRYLHEERKFQNPKGRDNPLGSGSQYEEVEYDLNDDGYYETKYDIDTLLFKQDRDQNGTYEVTLEPRDVTKNGEVDTVPYFVYEESGTYDIALKSTDSTGCEQIRRQEEKIIVTDIKAFIGLDKIPGVCAPQTVSFKDSSVVFNAYRFTYDSAGNPVDSTRVDSTASWKWSFTDEREETPSIKNPEYVFTRNGEFGAEFIATTATGCSDTTSKIIQPSPDPNAPDDTVETISLIGPDPGFVITNPKGCEPHTVEFKDTSERVERWTFFRGDGDQANFDERPNDSIFEVEYDSGGVYYASLLAEATVPNTATADPSDSVNCAISFPDTSELSGKPLSEYQAARVYIKETNQALFSVENDPLCPGEPLVVTNESSSYYDSFDFAMGNGDTVTTYTTLDSTLVEDRDTTIFQRDTTVVVDGDSVDFQAGDSLITDGYDFFRNAEETFEYDYGLNADTTITIRVLPMGSDTLCYDTFERTFDLGGIKADLDTLPSRAPIFRFTNMAQYGDEYEWFFPDGTIQDSVTAENWDEVVESDPGRPAADVSDKTKEGGNYNNGVLTTTNRNLEPELDYRSDNGDYDVCLLVRRNDFGCEDVACMTINNPFDTTFERANVLTPNGDGENDRLQFELEGAVEFELRVYNRWGDLVYESKKGQGNYRCEESGGQTRRCKFWNGKKNNSGSDAPAGTYYYTFEYKLRDGKKEQNTGVITLIR